MAISDALPGVEVTIIVDGRPLQEYIEADVDEEPKSVTRYVEAASDQHFAVSLEVAKGTHMKGNCFMCMIFVDGQWVASPLVDSSTVQRQGHTRVTHGYTPSPTVIHRFRFTSLEKASDGKILNREAKLIKSLGTIKAVVSHRNRLETFVPTDEAISGVGIVSEKALKGRALSHSVAFDEPTTRDKETFWNTELVDKEEPVAAKIVFNYRSRESLSAEMIIPRTPSPPPLEEKEQLSQEEVRELQRQMRSLRAAPVKLKRERIESPSSNAKKRARHMPSAGDTQYVMDDSGTTQTSTAHLPPRKEPEVVDLTIDEDS